MGIATMVKEMACQREREARDAATAKTAELEKELARRMVTFQPVYDAARELEKEFGARIYVFAYADVCLGHVRTEVTIVSRDMYYCADCSKYKFMPSANEDETGQIAIYRENSVTSPLCCAFDRIHTKSVADAIAFMADRVADMLRPRRRAV